MKKFLSLVIIIVMLVSLVACGNPDKLDNDVSEVENSTTISSTEPTISQSISTTTETVKDTKETATSDVEASTSENKEVSVVESSSSATIYAEEGKLYSMEDMVSYKNSVFEYTDLYFSDYDTDFNSVILYYTSIKNITSVEQKPNIRIKFYDENKNMILDYQHVRTIPDSDTTRKVQPQETLRGSFTLYDGKTHFMDFEDSAPNKDALKNAKYFSFEPLEEVK